MLRNADAEPATARAVLIESLAAGPAVRAEHERSLDSIEAALDSHLSASGGPQIEIPARLLLGGVANVIAIRVFRGEAGRLADLLDDLLAWIDAYALPGGRRRLTADDWAAMGRGLGRVLPESLGDKALGCRLPRGRGSLSPAIVTSEQRERILAAIARLSREKGYAAMTVADVIAMAGVTREAFYELFRGRQDAFLATQAYGMERSVALTAGSFFGEEMWPDRVWNGAETSLAYIAGQRDLVFVDLVESYAAGQAAIRRSFENRMAYTLFLEEGYRQRPEAEGLPRISSEAINELIRLQVVRGGIERMGELLPQVAYLTLAPFIGPAEALGTIEEKVARAAMRTPRARSRE